MQNLFRRSLAGNLVLFLIFLEAGLGWTNESCSKAAEIATLQPVPQEQQPRATARIGLCNAPTPRHYLLILFPLYRFIA